MNRGRIRDALAGTEQYKGVTGQMMFDPNSKNIVPLYLATVRNGKIGFRRYPMQAPYAKVGEDGVHITGRRWRTRPPVPMAPQSRFSDRARTASPPRTRVNIAWPAISSDVPWGKASAELVKLIYEDDALAIIATDRNSSHLAEQLAVKAFVPVIAISADRDLTAVKFRGFSACLKASHGRCAAVSDDAAERSGANRGRLREELASGAAFAGQIRFDSTGRIAGAVGGTVKQKRSGVTSSEGVTPLKTRSNLPIQDCRKVHQPRI